MSDKPDENETENPELTETETPPPPAVKEQVETPKDSTDLSELKEMVKGMGETVNGLVTAVAGLVNRDQNPVDDSPVGLPWTHRGGGK